jgi:hypothetical protein
MVHAHAGTWNLILTVDPKMFKRYLSVLRDGPDKTTVTAIPGVYQFVVSATGSTARTRRSPASRW